MAGDPTAFADQEGRRSWLRVAPVGEGVALARLVGELLGPFASVVTSASPRAIETAVAMGFAVGETVELPSGYVPGEVDHHEQWRWPDPYRTYAQLLGPGGGLAAVAEAHSRIWTRVVAAVPDGAAALVVAHGGGSSRGWWPACRTPTTSCGVRRSATVTAHASASARAGSSVSSSPGCRKVMAHLRMQPAARPPSTWELRDGQIYRWVV